MPTNTAANGVVDAPFSTGDLAQRLAQSRIAAADQNNQTAETDQNREDANSGEDGANGDGSASHEELAAGADGTGDDANADAGNGDGGNADGADGNADGQVTGDNANANADGNADAANNGDEALNLDNVPKLTPEQRSHVDQAFRKRFGEFKRSTMDKAEQKVKAADSAREIAEQRAQQFEQQLQQAQSQPVATTPDNPLANITDANGLTKAVQEAQGLKTWATQQLRRLDRNPASVEAQLKELKVELPEYTPEAMEDWLLRAQDGAEATITIHAPQRQQYLQQEAHWNTQAEKDFPFLKDVKSQEYADVQQIVRGFPEIKSKPHWKVIASIFAEGLKVTRAREAAAKAGNGNGNGNGNGVKPVKRPVPPKINTRPGAAARPAEPGTVQRTAAQEKFQKTGSVNALANLLASKRANNA